MPLLNKGGRPQYIPWGSQDLQNLITTLPDIQEGAAIWIRKLEEEMTGKTLALGDVKALLTKVVGKEKMLDIIENAGYRGADKSTVDGRIFDQYRQKIWDSLRKAYPTQPSTVMLKGVPMKEEESAAAFVENQLRNWRMTLDKDIQGDPIMTAMFRAAILEGLPDLAKRRLEQTIFEQERANEQENPAEGHHLRPGDLVYVRKFRRRWNEQRREGPFRITRTSPTALQVEGSNMWYHLNHCTRAVGGEQEDEQSETQEGDDRQPPGEEGAESGSQQSENREVWEGDEQPEPSGISAVPQLASSSDIGRSPNSELRGNGGEIDLISLNWTEMMQELQEELGIGGLNLIGPNLTQLIDILGLAN
ncbi:hypothetical protein SKAU_G00415070 [Synaphobranchus kaupii]|uniref:Murine leukemia virus integrase C-terminal domain-containing protein n=1 Tax=Synaphobranchus kaupii TaxID=118154 RepID=A0A9Q1E751_SYNKA|nr:hypothetical protein SKAU_G00415070 [Synaphobranchus kaupii]